MLVNIGNKEWEEQICKIASMDLKKNQQWIE